MRKIRNKRVLLLILLVTVPIILFFNLLNSKVSANKTIPETHPNNNWEWSITEGDILWFEFEVVNKIPYSDEITHMFKNLVGLNITTIGIIEKDLIGLGLHNVSQISATQMWFDSVSYMPYPFGGPKPIAHFGYDNSTMTGIDEIYYLEGEYSYQYIPLILPINVSSGFLDVEYLTNIIYSTCYWNLAGFKLNYFDYYFANNLKRNIYFGCHSDPFFINATYFDDGTLKEAEYHIIYEQKGMEMIETHEKINRVFDTEIGDEVEWGVNIGDVLYFGENSHDQKFVEKKIEITGFSTWNYDGHWDFDPYIGYLPMSFKEIWANISVWDPSIEEFRFEYQDVVGIANNFYPTLPWQSIYKFEPYIFDRTATIEELEFMQNKFSCKYIGLDEFHMDFDGKFLHFEGMNYSSPYEDRTIRGIADMERGVIKLMQRLSNDYLDSIRFEKNFAPLFSGYNNLMLKSEYIHELSFNAQITTTRSGIHLLYAILKESPVPQRMPYGEPLFYVDMMVTNHISVNSMSMRITFPWHIELNSTRLIFFRWNSYDGFHGDWHDIPEEEINKTLTFNYETNSITIEFNMNEHFSNVFALAYEPKYDDDYNNGDDEYYIPGYDLMIVLGIISLAFVGLIGIKRKYISKN